MKFLVTSSLFTVSLLTSSAFAQVVKNIPLEVGQSAEISVDSSGDKVVVSCGGQEQSQAGIVCDCFFGFQKVGQVVGNSSSDFNRLCADGPGFDSVAENCRAI